MISRVSGVLAAVALLTAFTAPVSAELRQGPSIAMIVTAQASTDSAPAAARSGKRKQATSKREPTASQLMARERQKKCAAEWKSAKAAGTVASGMKWPKFWSACNARLKGNSA